MLEIKHYVQIRSFCGQCSGMLMDGQMWRGLAEWTLLCAKHAVIPVAVDWQFSGRNCCC